MKRERNAKDAKKGGNSQLKGVSLVYGYMVKDDIYSPIFSNQNEAAKNIICKTCFQTFLCTSREKA